MKKKILKDNEKLFNELKIGSLVKTIRPISDLSLINVLNVGMVAIVLKKKHYNDRFYVNVSYGQKNDNWFLYCNNPFFEKLLD